MPAKRPHNGPQTPCRLPCLKYHQLLDNGIITLDVALPFKALESFREGESVMAEREAIRIASVMPADVCRSQEIPGKPRLARSPRPVATATIRASFVGPFVDRGVRRMPRKEQQLSAV